MRVFKTTYKDKSGQTRQAANWYVEIKDHLEHTRRLPAFVSKAASEEMGRNLVKLPERQDGSSARSTSPDGGRTDPPVGGDAPRSRPRRHERSRTGDPVPLGG